MNNGKFFRFVRLIVASRARSHILALFALAGVVADNFDIAGKPIELHLIIFA